MEGRKNGFRRADEKKMRPVWRSRPRRGPRKWTSSDPNRRIFRVLPVARPSATFWKMVSTIRPASLPVTPPWTLRTTAARSAFFNVRPVPSFDYRGDWMNSNGALASSPGGGLRPASRDSAKPAPVSDRQWSTALQPASHASPKPAPLSNRHRTPARNQHRSPTGIARQPETSTILQPAPHASAKPAPLSNRHRTPARNQHHPPTRITQWSAGQFSRWGPPTGNGAPVSDRHRAGARNQHRSPTGIARQPETSTDDAPANQVRPAPPSSPRGRDPSLPDGRDPSPPRPAPPAPALYRERFFLYSRVRRTGVPAKP